MNRVAEPSAGDWVADGYLNRVVGWSMLLLGLALAAGLDPWFFSPESAAAYADSLRPAVRHAQGVVLGMALLQLAMAHLLRTPSFTAAVRRMAACLTTVGALVYAAGYALGLKWPALHGLVLAGSLLNLSGFAYLLWVQPTGSYAAKIRLILPVACFGMLLDFTAGLLLVFPEPMILDHLGADDGVRLRMLRLARVAAIALSVLVLLYLGLVRSSAARSRTVEWAGFALVGGAIGMPAILAAACFTSLYLKYLLAIPATLVVTGVYVGLWQAWRHAPLLERWGWLLVAVSVSVGMLMGLYAFAGPLPTPEFLGPYNDLARRLSRIAHSYCIVLGILAVFLSRETVHVEVKPRIAHVAGGVFALGSAVTIGMLLLRMAIYIPAGAFALGPAIAVAAAGTCLLTVVYGREGEYDDDKGHRPD